MTVLGRKIKLKEKADMCGLTEDVILVSGGIIRCMAKESMSGMMEGFTKEPMWMIRNMVLENIYGKTEKSFGFLFRYIGEWNNGV